MININEKVRARVLDVEGQVATLGVYVQGAWARMNARTEVALVKGAWLTGHLVVPPDGSMVLFRVLEEDAGTPPAGEPPPSNGGLDIQA